MHFHTARKLAERLRRPTIYPLNIPPSNECLYYANQSTREHLQNHHLSINSISHNQPNLLQYPSGVLKMARKKSSARKAKWFDAEFAFNKNTLSELRATLNPTQLSRLPRLPQLSFQTLDAAPPHSSQAALLIGHFVSPNEDPIHLGAPVYAFANRTVCDAYLHHPEREMPRAWLDFVGDGPKWPMSLYDADEVEERKGSKKRAALKGKYPADHYTSFLSWRWPAHNGIEFEAQVLLCFLLADEAKMIPRLKAQKGPAKYDLLAVLREVYDREPGSEYPMDWGSHRYPGITDGLYVVPRWRAGKRLTDRQYELCRDWSNILSRSILKQLSELKAMEHTHRFIEALPDADPPQELSALGLDLQPFRGAKRNMDALGEMIVEKRARVRKLSADKDRLDGQMSPWMLPSPGARVGSGAWFWDRRYTMDF